MSGKKEKAVQFILPFAGGAVNQCYYVDEDELEEKLPADNTAALLEKAAAGRLSARSLTRHRDALLRAAVAADRAEALPALMPKRRMEPERFLELVSFAEKNGSPAAMAWLLQYRRAHYSPAEFDALAERRLDLELGLAEMTEAELRRLFRLRYLKGGVCVCGVRTERRSYEIPASIGGKPVIGVDAAAFYAQDPMPRVRRVFSGGTDSRRLQTLQAGERIRLGRSMAKRGTAESPLSWRVLCREKGRTLVLCERPVAILPYQRELREVTWETSDLRRWLNTVFLPLCFSEEERASILTTRVETPDNVPFGSVGGNAAEDRLFLLSAEEAETWTDAAFRALGRWWWLRTPGFDNSFAAAVTPEGKIVRIGSFADAEDYAVRPAMWIRTDEDREQTGEGQR